MGRKDTEGRSILHQEVLPKEDRDIANDKLQKNRQITILSLF